tara:strand:+ start:1231 stop:2541 length:1311 start_codon:yes stop_codon:yes gene_type:complete
MSRIVAIVGRPNVGKSTFFNRLTQSNHSIVDSVSGVTRDRIYGKSHWNGVDFSVIDTGGYNLSTDEIFNQEINDQVQLAINESDIIIFLVDAKSGVTPQDKYFCDILRKIKKKVFLVVNKVDNNKMIDNSYDFYSLGLGDYFYISANNGFGTGDLLDEVIKCLPDDAQENENEKITFAIAGRPNVGKSTFINTLIENNRTIVTNIAGTTRDSIYVNYKKFGYDFQLIDTAGLRKKNKVNEDLEFYSTLRTIKAIENSDISFLLIDAQNGIESQDLNILNIILNNNKGVVILINKWDLIDNKNEINIEDEKQKIIDKIKPFSDISILFISALKRQRVLKAIDEGLAVYDRKNQKISTSKLNDYILKIVSDYPPPMVRQRRPKIKYCTQIKNLQYPSFIFFCNTPKNIKDPYKRFLENKIREKFNYRGVPIKLNFRQK